MSNCHKWLCMQAKSEVQKLIVKAQDGALEAQPGRTIMESFEGQVSLQVIFLAILFIATLTESVCIILVPAGQTSCPALSLGLPAHDNG